MAARFGIALFALLAVLGTAAPAQQYQRLHVRSFTLTSDAAHPQLEQPFHVTLTVVVTENVERLDNVFLPTFFGAEELGDVQQVVHGRSGTTYRETLTLVAHKSGMLSIGSAYLDAIDARDGKAKRFISNPLQLPVGAGPAGAVRSILRTAFALAADVVLAAAALTVIAAIFLRRKRSGIPEEPVRPEPAPEPAETAPPRGPREDLADALEALRVRRDRGGVLRVRAALWHLAGASSGDTLGDVLRGPAAGDERMRRMLSIVERAAFIEQARVHGAIDDILAESEWRLV